MRIGIDLGGTKIEAIGLRADGSDAVVADPRRVPTPRSYAGTLDAIAGLVAELEREAGESGTVGVGIPGVVDRRTKLVKNANSVWLIGEPLQEGLQQQLGRPVRLANDANCFALSEATDGAGAPHDVVFGVILGTGVGGGIAFRRHIHEGPNQIAGEWGHNQLPWLSEDEWPGPRCYCGKLGCVESFLSGPGFEGDFLRAAGRKLSGREIVAAAERGDADARAALARYVDRLARALAGVINLLDPDVIVLGGGMSNLPDLPEAVTAAIPRYIFNDAVHTPIVRNVHGDSSGVRGAAWLWND